MISYNFGNFESLDKKINDEFNYINKQKNIQNNKNSSLLSEISNFSSYHDISIDEAQDLHKFKLKLLSENFSYLTELENKLIEIKSNIKNNNNNVFCEIVKENLKQYDNMFLNYQMKILNNNIKLDDEIFIENYKKDIETQTKITNQENITVSQSGTNEFEHTINCEITNNIENKEIEEPESQINSSITTNVQLQEIKDENYRKIFKLVINEDNRKELTSNVIEEYKINEEEIKAVEPINLDFTHTTSTHSDVINNTEPNINNSDEKQNSASLFNIISNNTNNEIPSKQDEQFKNLSDNKTLLISEKDNKIYLPYTVKDIKYLWYEQNDTNQSAQDLINKFYTVPLNKYKNSTLARFKESMSLMLNKEYSTFFEALEFAFEMSIKSSLNPAVIAACKNIDELNTYLECLENNTLDSYPYFEIKYDINPL